MDVLIAIAALVLAIASAVGAVAGNMIASELYDRAPSFADWLIEHAVARLPEHEQERYREEWRAHLDQCPGKLGKVWHAIGFAYGARSVATALGTPRASATVISRSKILVERTRKLAKSGPLYRPIWEVTTMGALMLVALWLTERMLISLKTLFPT